MRATSSSSVGEQGASVARTHLVQSRLAPAEADAQPTSHTQRLAVPIFTSSDNRGARVRKAWREESSSHGETFVRIVRAPMQKSRVGHFEAEPRATPNHAVERTAAGLVF
jgi:hypothetical protein